ncbi:MAG: phosphoglucosamine mutase [bacterium]
MSQLMVSVSGVRGVIGEGLSPDVILNFSQAFGTYLNKGTVVLGRDSRVSGDMLKNVAISGLMSVGCSVIDIGVCPTPTTQLAVESQHADGGMMITASHNPIMWNGLKLIGSDGLFLDEEQGEKVVALSKSQDLRLVPWDKLGQVSSYFNAIDKHIQTILSLEYIDVDAIKKRNFKVVLDCVCGAGSNLVPALLQQLGCQTVEMYCEPTGRFPRNPEPLPENLFELCEKVQAEGADLGVAVDPDSDRLALVSEKGEPLGEEKTLAIAVQHVLAKKPGAVVINASTSLVTEDVAKESGAEVTRTKVGEIHVAKKMREIGAVIGGEGNGGVILPAVHLGRDAPIGIALVLQRLLDFDGPISALNESLPSYVISKNKIPLGELEPETALKKIRENYANEKLDFTDGVKIVRTSSWIHIRPSNTEPIMRVIAEAPTKEESERLCREVMEKISY